MFSPDSLHQFIYLEMDNIILSLDVNHKDHMRGKQDGTTNGHSRSLERGLEEFHEDSY